MKGQELKEITRIIQSGNLNMSQEILNYFGKLIYTISYINGKIDEDCLQELRIQVLYCLLRFQAGNFPSIREFIETSGDQSPQRF